MGRLLSSLSQLLAGTKSTGSIPVFYNGRWRSLDTGIHDVRHYGATGDGTTDDYAAIAAAITAAGTGGTVVFPKATATYRISQALVPLDYQTWQGPGGFTRATTGYPTIRSGASYAGPLVSVPGTLAGWTCRGLGFWGRGAISGSSGVDISTANRIRIEDCMFDTFGEQAIRIGAGVANVIARNHGQNIVLVRSGRSDYIGALDLSSTDDFVSENEFTTSSLSIAASGYIVALRAAGDNSFFARNVWEISEGGAYVSGSLNRFIGDRADLNRGHGWIVTGGSNQFVGCLGVTNGQETNDTYSNWRATAASANNLFIGCAASDLNATKCKYGFEDLVESATTKNSYMGCQSKTAVTAQFIGGSVNQSAMAGFPAGASKTLTANSATPDVTAYERFSTANTNPTTITNFLGGVAGQRIQVLCNDSNTTIQHNGVGITLMGIGDKKLRSGATYTFWANGSGTGWREAADFPLGATADVGDASKALQARVDPETQIWNTPLTTDRTVTLSATGAFTGASFRVTRTASATGAFSLNVGTGPLKALSAGQWCEVTHNGSAWVLTAFGSL